MLSDDLKNKFKKQEERRREFCLQAQAGAYYISDLLEEAIVFLKQEEYDKVERALLKIGNKYDGLLSEVIVSTSNLNTLTSQLLNQHKQLYEKIIDVIK